MTDEFMLTACFLGWLWSMQPILLRQCPDTSQKLFPGDIMETCFRRQGKYCHMDTDWAVPLAFRVRGQALNLFSVMQM